MSGWIVFGKDGSIERCKLKSLEYGGTAMGERAVTATFDYHSEVAFEVFDYIEYRGERFELESVPTVKKLSSFEYQYELRFVSLKYELERCEMRDLVPGDNGVAYPTPLTFSFTGDVRYLTDRIQACLDAMYGLGVWEIIVANGVESEEKNITIAQQNCWNALALVNSTYGLNFYIKGRTITIGGEQPLVGHTFEYGKGNGLYEIERASDTETGIVTKLRAYGSTRNLDYSYPKKPEWSDSVLPVSFALSPLRLMLPSFKTDGKTDYVLADDAAIAKYGIREASMVYDDIYPSIAGATYNGQAIDEIKAVDAVDESKKTFVVYLHDLGFDLEEHLTTSDAQISMKSGALQGYTFTISTIEKQTGGYKITLGKNSLENSEESGAYVPGVNWNMKAGDKFVLLNILMPQKYIRDAENRLLARANEYLAQYSKTNFSYNIGLHDKFLIQNPTVYDSLIEGSKLKVYDKEIGIDEEVTIQSITITENLEDNILPQVKVTLNNEPSASTLDRIQGKLNEVAAETAANGFTTQSEIRAQYRRKLDKPFFDKLFVAIDKNGNEIPSTDVITPIAYIKAKYHVASVGGFTMYAMDKDLDIPSLASGLPFDGRTIWYNPETQQIEVIGGTSGGSGEGVSNFWDLSGIPSWITNSKPKYTYSEIEGTPDLSGFATQNWIISQGYASAEELKKYIPISGYTEVSGEKNFVGGLKVNGSPIYYDTEKKYWKLEGDLLVTGGVTMYGSDSSFTPSTIMDAIVVDGTTISKDGGVLKINPELDLGGLDEAELEGYLTVNKYVKESALTEALSTYATQAWVKARGYATTSDLDSRINALVNGAPAAYDTLKEIADVLAGNVDSIGDIITTLGTKWTQDNTKIANWDTAYSWGNHASVGYALKSYVDGNFVTLATDQTISGLKNFSNGLELGGISVYKSQDGVLYLDGNLVVKGGVTMYGTDATSSPSILDSLPIASTSSKGIAQFNPSDFSVVNGVVSFVGSVDGGVASSVAWGNITGKPTFASVATSGKYSDLSGTPSSLPASDVYSWAKAANKPSYAWSEITSKPTWIGSSKPTYSYSEITGAISTTELQNHLTSNSYLNVTSGDNRYLQLSGGTMKGHINIVASGTLLSIRQTNGGTSYINFRSEINGTNTDLGDLGVNVSKDLVYYKDGWKKVWHEGNFTPSNYLPLSGGKLTGTIIVGDFTSFGASGGNFYIGSPEYPLIIRSNGTTSVNGSTLWHSGNDGSGSGLDADLLDGKHNGDLTAQYFSRGKMLTKADTINKLMSGVYCYINGDNPTGSVDDNVILLAFRNESRDDMFQLAGAANTVNLYYRRAANVGNSYENWTNWEKIAFTSSNVASANKLKTARTIWGQSFDGTGNVDGPFTYRTIRLENNNEINAFSNFETKVGGPLCLQWESSGNLILCIGGGNVSIGKIIPQYKLDIVGDTMLTGGWYRSKGAYGWYSEDYAGGWYMTDAAWIRNYNNKPLLLEIGTNNTNGIGGHSAGLTLRGTNHCSIMMIGTNGGAGYGWGIAANADGNFYVGRRNGESVGYSSSTDSYKFRLDGSGNGLFYGGVTMYSDKRKKTILNHVELSLKQIADAPLIEHYYNSDESKTTHVGSIAQYWANMNDWFCKLDSEGFYTMEIQNAALASAISIARELDRYETKTDKAIKMLKKRICELEEEVERLKSA